MAFTASFASTSSLGSHCRSLQLHAQSIASGRNGSLHTPKGLSSRHVAPAATTFARASVPEIIASTAAAASAATHVDKAALRDDSVYRYQYLSEFMGFSEEDIALIKSSAPLLGPLVPGLVEAVYEKLLSFDATKSYFVPPEGPEGLDGAAEAFAKVIAYRKAMLNSYLTKLVTADYDGDFVAYIDRVGKVHTHSAGDRRVEVELVHVSALFGFVHDALISTFAVSAPPFPSGQAVDPAVLDEGKKWALVRAFSKLLWIQSDFFTRWYTRNDHDD
eukprot:tig00000900_g5395.t1